MHMERSMTIRRLVDDGDEPQRDGATPADGPGTAPLPGRDASVASRRGFVRNLGLGAVAFGAVAASGVALASGVGAATAAEDPPELAEADRQILRFLQSVELAGVAGCTAALDGGELGPAATEMLRTFRQYHRDHAQAFGALLDSALQVTVPNPGVTAPLVASIGSAADEQAVLRALYAYEESAAATLLRSLGLAESWLVAGPIATILPIDGMQAAVIGAMADVPTSEWLPAFTTVDGAFEPALQPVS
jgi:hypothetical protein